MASIHDLTSQAGFVFEGEVEQVGGSLASGFPASDRTVIVRISKILKSTETLTGYIGNRITVDCLAPVTLRPGQPAVFFTHGVHYGDTMVVREVGNASPASTMEAQVNTAAQAGSDQELTNRLAQAELVITGVASAPKPYAGAGAAVGVVPRISEHDPQWWSTTVRVETTEKGENPGPLKQVLFSSSKDIAWYRSPKVKEGDRGVWLLHKRDLRGKAVPGHAVVHQLDFHPIEQLARVRTLLKG